MRAIASDYYQRVFPHFRTLEAMRTQRAQNFESPSSGHRRLNLFAKSVIFAVERRQSSIYS
jgi:hypothetical protein